MGAAGSTSGLVIVLILVLAPWCPGVDNERGKERSGWCPGSRFLPVSPGQGERGSVVGVRLISIKQLGLRSAELRSQAQWLCALGAERGTRPVHSESSEWGPKLNGRASAVARSDPSAREELGSG